MNKKLTYLFFCQFLKKYKILKIARFSLMHLLILAVLFFLSHQYQAKAQTAEVEATVQITVCGNEIIESGEDCDNASLGGESCSSRGFTSGSLNCNTDCSFNTSNCASGGGGGGGGGFTVQPVTSVTFSGKAYPETSVTLLKDAQIAATTIAGINANFQIDFTGLAAGNYNFSLYSEDKDGRRSSLLIFPVSVTRGTITNISGIFIAPTIDVDKKEVKRGENLAIFGQSAPLADITITVNSTEEFFKSTISDQDGVYLYNFDTSVLEYGTHNVKSKASLGNQLVSNFSYVVNFKVSTKTELAEPTKECSLQADLNEDCRVNLIDFSILAYWYKRISPPVSVDLNSDGKVDLVDFSIMAYYWTG